MPPDGQQLNWYTFTPPGWYIFTPPLTLGEVMDSSLTVETNTSRWRRAFFKSESWNSPKAQKVQKIEAEIALQWLLGMGLERYDILEIGCGGGSFGYAVVSYLLAQGIPYSYCFSDIVPECIEQAKIKMADLNQTGGVTYRILDVFTLDKAIDCSSQDIIISTGYASAATYKDAVPVVSRVLKPEGVLICDFINHFSPLLMAQKFPGSFSQALNALRGKGSSSPKHYHFGRLGIKNYGPRLVKGFFS